MNDGPIGFIDSGIGGISVLKEVQKLLPFEHYIYYGDSIHNPYGQKRKKDLFKIVDQIVRGLLQNKCKLIVIACNTATVMTIDLLRKKYKNTLFVGIEPAIKVAYDYHRNKRILLMATPATIQSERLHALSKKYDSKNVKFLACPNLAHLIEEGNLDKVQNDLNNLLDPFRGKVDVVVLGCTHYPFVKQEIKNVLGDVIFLDGSDGVARRVKQLLLENNLLGENKSPYLRIENSKNEDEVKKSYELLKKS